MGSSLSRGLGGLMFFAVMVGVRVYFYQAAQNGFQFTGPDESGDITVSSDTTREIFDKVNARLLGDSDQGATSPWNAPQQVSGDADRLQKQLNAWEIAASKNAGQPRVPL